MMKISSIIIGLFLFGISLYSQNFTLSGFVEDSQTGERLIGAYIYDSLTYNSSQTNTYGFFSIICKAGQVDLICRNLGYSKIHLRLSLSADTNILVRLSPLVYSLSEVLINNNRNILENPGISTVILPVTTIKGIPLVLGEADIIKSLQYMPGVQAGTEGTTGFYVRGGGPDQNLILLDGVPVYNADHLFGFISIFNPDAIKNVIFITGGFPARYGGRLSSVLDIQMKEGNYKKFHGEAGLGIASSKIYLEGPLIKDKSSFLVSARRSWIDIFTKTFFKEKDLPSYYFYDVTGKLNFKLSDRNILYFSIYTGKDNITGIKTESSITNESIRDEIKQDQYSGWGNITTSLRWNYSIKNNLFLNTSLNYSRYYYYDYKSFERTLTNLISDFKITNYYKSDFSSGLEDIGIKSDFDYHPAMNHHLKFGLSFFSHTISPYARIYSVNPGTDTTFNTKTVVSQLTMEPSLYFEDEMQFNKTSINSGIRVSSFLVNGQLYFGVEPRLIATYAIKNNLSVKVAYTRMTQYLLLLSSSRITFPADLWVSATDSVKPQVSNQMAAGVSWNCNSDLFEISIEGYFKSMSELIEYKDGSSFLNSGYWQNQVTKGGSGRAYGLELLLKKNSGKINGWISYTLAKSERKFDEINSGNWFPYKYDRRHDLNLFLDYKFGKMIDMGITWEYTSGSMYTLVTDVYDSYLGTGPLYDVQYFENRNNYRLPAFHHLDFCLSFNRKKKSSERIWSLNIYNVYNRKNVFFLYYDTYSTESDGEKIILKKFTLFPIIPSLSYSIKF